ncbi:hypothetical protein [Dyella acidiphila]|uniref:MipA/OmpV family protein n=1 Tax=Dyella acidiphila TaxID=2775866 RepID=A0ABR9GD18_9GAMM|nr:hypothetical protein [Dyella acidiphila]MBE1161915.1 hypothetical protein [Dyella acidiphila]
MRVALVATLLLAGPLHAQTGNFAGTVALSSQLVDRGIALTPVTPILQGAVNWSSAGGWMAGVSIGTQLRSPDRSEGLAQLGHYWTLSDDWRMQADATYYGYSGNTRASAYNRAEASVNWMYRDVLSFGLSAITLTGGDDHHPRGAADLDFHWPLPWHLSLAAGAGITQTLVTSRPPWPGAHHYYDYGYGGVSSYYGYGQLGLIWAWGPWQVELQRIATTSNIARQTGSLAAAPWVGTVSWSF